MATVTQKEVLHGRASLMHHQRHRAWGCPLPGMAAGCEGGCAARGAQGCASEQGPCALSMCQGRILLPARVNVQPAWDHLTMLGEKLWVKMRPWPGQGLSAVEAVLHGSGLVKAPHHPQDTGRGCFGRRTSRQHLSEREALSAL